MNTREQIIDKFAVSSIALAILLLFFSCNKDGKNKPKTNPGTPEYSLHYIQDIEISGIVALRSFDSLLVVFTHSTEEQANIFRITGNTLEEAGARGTSSLGELTAGNHYTVSSSGICLCDEEGHLFVAQTDDAKRDYWIPSGSYSFAYAAGGYVLAYSSEYQRLDLYLLAEEATLLRSFPVNKLVKQISYFKHFFIFSFAEGYGIIDMNADSLHIEVRGDQDFKDIDFFVVDHGSLKIEGSSKIVPYHRIAKIDMDEDGNFQYISRNEEIADHVLAFSSRDDTYYIYRQYDAIQVFHDYGASIESVHNLPVSNFSKWQVSDSCGVCFYGNYVYAIRNDRAALRFFRLGMN